MVALDDDGRPTEVPPLEAESEDEQRREREAQTRRRNRLAERDEIQRGPLGVRLEPERVARREAARVAQRDAPARAALGGAHDLAAGDAAGARVQAQAGDDGEGVAGVRVDRDPGALAASGPSA